MGKVWRRWLQEFCHKYWIKGKTILKGDNLMIGFLETILNLTSLEWQSVEIEICLKKC